MTRTQLQPASASRRSHANGHDGTDTCGHRFGDRIIRIRQ